MKHIKNFSEYDENLVLEKLNLSSFFNMFKTKPNKKIATLIIGGLLSVFTITQAFDFIQNKQDINPNQKTYLLDILKQTENSEMTLSDTGYDFIKNEEKLKLKAYDIKDGKISVGFGHAQPIKKSQYKVGDKITIAKAFYHLKTDVETANNGIQRILNEWKSKGINVKLTQQQYDAMVSMAYNMGIQNFRNSDFIQKIKRNELDKAANLIKTTGLRDNYAGLKLRREREYKLFIS